MPHPRARFPLKHTTNSQNTKIHTIANQRNTATKHLPVEIDLTGESSDTPSAMGQQNNNNKRPPIEIDLTESDNEVTRARKAARSTQDSGYQSQSSQPYQPTEESQVEEDESERDADDLIMYTQESGVSNQAFETYERYGTIETKIVGLQYYSGFANQGEYIVLAREPNNHKDRNAIKVENVRRQQIGYVPRQVAVKLAKYLDRQLLMAEGILTGRRGTYDMPMDIGLFGTSEGMEKQSLRVAMEQDGLPVEALQRREKAEQKAADKYKKEELRQAAQGYKSSGAPSSQQELQGPSMADLMAESQTFNPREIAEQSERYGLSEEDLSKLPKAKQPQRITTKMLPYQLQGLQWLFEKENLQPPAMGSRDIVQLWKRSQSNNQAFTNIATNISVKDEDLKLASGGILADDMGLGKTLEIIALIITDMERFNLKHRDQRATLIVAPVSVMSNWSGQIAQHVDSEHPLNVMTYHGQKKPKINSRYIKDNEIDVVITTYGTLSTEYMPAVKKNAKPPPVPRSSGLFSVNWRRIVLDEGHNIRNPSTKGALSAAAVLARSRWALTGTPIINNLKDLYSLLRFIGIAGGLERIDVFSSVLIRPMTRYNDTAVALLQTIMGTFCLRRKKEMSFVNLKLPKLEEYIHRVKFLQPEQERYNGLQGEARGMLREYQRQTERGEGLLAQEAYHHLLEILLRLRQVCNHWRLCPERMASIMKALEERQTIELNDENRKALQDMLQLSMESHEDCPICLQDLNSHEPVITHCAHVFGKPCITRVVETQRKCPMCRAPLENEDKLVEPAAGLGEADDADTLTDVDTDKSSSKVDALLSIVAATHKQLNPKIVIFSQWTRFLTLLEPHLLERNYTFTRLDGTMSAAARDQALTTFDRDPNTSILLASLSVCAVGLNLVAANTVVLSDSWWAPAIEDQAVDRIHRLGQKRDCTVWRLVMEESIEERVLDIQDRKRKLMMAAFRETENKRERGRRTRLADIQRLLEF